MEGGKYRELQGTYPVISLSFANIKEKDYLTTRKKICQLLTKLYAAELIARRIPAEHIRHIRSYGFP